MKVKPMRVFTRYDELASTQETNHFLIHLSWIFAGRLYDPSLRTKVGILLRGGHLRELAELELKYGDLTVADAFHLGQIKAFFSKREDLDLGVDRAAEAALKFEQAESLCASTNHIIRLRNRGLFSLRPRVEAVLFAAQRKICRILGDVPTLKALRPRFGPGANTTIKKADSCFRNKLGAEVTASSELRPYSSELLAEMPGWFKRNSDGALASVVTDPALREDVGVVEFVPKSWKTDRAIVKEPMLNTMWQLGIGDYIAERLTLFGCDLQNGQHLNRAAARSGSLTGELATLDLSSASDTISTEIVYDLLPQPWSDFLRKFRTGTVLLNGDRVLQQKFSSMGNGFTFPLETLLFYAIAKSVSDEAYVFGDDIIVRTDSVEILLEVLAACGFLVNQDKSFTSGPFRESCGGDYLSGFDIRPCFVKNRMSAAGVMVLHNFFAARFDTELTDLCRHRLRRGLQLEGPAGFGDGYLHIANPTLHPKGRDRGWGGYCFDTFLDSSPRSFEISKGDYVLPCYSVYLSPEGEASPLGNPGRLVSKYNVYRKGRLVTKGQTVGTSPRYWVDVEAPASCSNHDKQGRLWVNLPGTCGYKRITIYLANKV